MKLLFCLFNYFPYGGLQKNCLRMAQLCAAHGHEVEILTAKWQGERPHGVKVTLLKVRALTNAGFVKKFVRQAQQYFHTHHVDLVIGFNRIPGIDVFYAADPCYAEKFMRLPWYKKLNPRRKTYLKLEQQLCTQQALHLLLLAPQAVNEFTRHYHLDRARIHLLPPGLEKDRYALTDYSAENQIALKRHYGLSANDTIILLIGSAFKTKGLDRALLALASLPEHLCKNLHFWVVGEGRKTAYQMLIKKISSHVQIKFLQGRDDVPQLLRASDLLLHPAYTDNTGNVLLEAMASAVPVITTDVCGYAPYVIEAHAGFVVPSPFEQTDLNARLAAFLSMADTTALRENGVKFCRAHDIHSRIEKAVAIIEKLGWDRV